MNTSSAFTPPRNAKPIDPVLRLGMEFDAETIHVVLCGGFPTLSVYLSYQKNVEVYHVSDAEELRELLADANGIPADLIVIYSYDFQALPPMTFYSPVDGHESTVKFSLDAMIANEDELNEWYALVDSLRPKKKRFIEGFHLYSKLHPESKEDVVL